MADFITDHIDIWTSAIKAKSAVGRGSSKKLDLYGIKKLRELILELAVRGKLVPQDPNDEPASELLKRIANEKSKLINDKKIKKEKLLPTITESEKPFDMPLGWSCERIGNLVSKLGSGSTPRGGKNAYIDSGIPFFRSQNIWNDGIKLGDVAYISEEIHQQMSNTKVIPDDVLLNITGASLGRSTIFPKELVEANVSQHVTIIRLIEPAMNKFLHLGILSPLIQKLVWSRQVGMAIEGLSKKVLEQFEFPIPPLAEQHRIVAKVDELMALCDRLESQTEASIDAHKTLVEVLLATLTNAKNADELNDSWQHLSQHFDVLFTTQASIDQLKQTILQLAVMGKLVKQDPNDEPASKLLERIAAEKEQLIKDKKIKKQKPLPIITDEEKPFDLPTGWGWSRISEILKGDTQNGLSKKANEHKDGIPLLRISSATTGTNFIINFDAHKMTTDITEAQINTYSLSQGDLLAVRFNGNKEFVGRVAVYLHENEAPVVYPDKLIRLRLFNKFSDSLLIRYFINSQKIRDVVEQYCSTTVGNWGISAKNFKTVPIPIPPLAEQHRIVSKVDEMMTLCDSLKANLKDAQTTQLHLTDAIVEQAL